MSLEENKAIIRSLYEALNKQDLASRLASMDEFYAPDFIDYTNQIRGLESLKQSHIQFTEGFPDVYRTIEDIIAEADKVWIRVKYTGTHTGEYRGLAPTGKKFTSRGVEIYRIVNGKIVECWAVDDWMDCFKQLGVIEYKGFPDEDVS